MNNKLIFLFFSIIFLNVPGAWAAPATHLHLSYDSKKIYIDADHPSDRLDRDFIQKVAVTKNAKDKLSLYFTHQISASKFVVALDYIANPGDHLDVELYSSEGGMAQGSIEVP